jgi:predicted dehydrogenase
MASKFRYVNDMIVAKQLVTSGILGDILLFENTFAGHVDMTKRWNSNPAISGGGVLIDNGTHSIDIVRYLLGPLESIQVIEGKRSQAIAVEDTVRIHAKTVEGTLAAIDLSWSINKQTPWYVSIYGTQGTVLIGWKESKYKRSTDQEWTVFGAGYDKSQAFASQLSNFCKAIDGQEPLLITSDDAIASAYTMDRAYESLRKDDWIAVSMRETSVDRIAS